MVRHLQVLVLIIQLVLPPRTVAETLLFIFPADFSSAPKENVPVKAGKICPCTGQAGCSCCGCCDEMMEDGAPTAPADETQADGGRNQKEDDIHGKCTRCTCKRAVGLVSSTDYLPDPRCLARCLIAPMSEAVTVDDDLYFSHSQQIDAPPPK